LTISCRLCSTRLWPTCRRVPQPVFRSRSSRRWSRIKALALIAVVGPIVYWVLPFVVNLVWPPRQDYLYQQAATLMASDRLKDWIRACDDFLGPLDVQFPNHPFKEQTQKWLDRIRDRILVDEAEGLNTKQNNGLGSFAHISTRRDSNGYELGSVPCRINSTRSWRLNIYP
jgi:hypothetical protein